MTRSEMLKAVAAAHTAWSLKHGDDIPYVSSDVGAKPTDLSIHQADRSAPPAVDDELNAQLVKLLAQRR